MNKTEFIKFVSEILVLIAMGCVPVITKSIADYIKNTVARIKAQTQNTTAGMFLNEIFDAVQTAVKTTNQTYVDAIKKNQGMLTEEEQAAAFNKSYLTAMDQISDQAQQYIRETYGDIGKYLTAKIEAEVHDQKNGNATGTIKMNPIS